MDFISISFGNLNSVKSDRIIYDYNTKEIVFASLIGYTSIIDASLKTLKGPVTGCYSSMIGSLKTFREQYETEIRRQQDSDYLHAIAYIKDIVTQEETGERFSAFLFCKSHSDLEQELFDKLTRYSSVPVLREWMHYIVDTMLTNRNLYELEIRPQTSEMCAYRVITSKNGLKDIIQTGLRSGAININNINTSSPILSEIGGLNDYLTAFGELLAEKIQGSFRPKFIPGEDEYDEFTNNIDDSLFSAGIEMYEAQKSIVQATVNNLKINDTTFVIGEMGSGNICCL